jgi:hypothetical protein
MVTANDMFGSSPSLQVFTGKGDTSFHCTVLAKKTVQASDGKLHSAGQVDSCSFCWENAQCRPSRQSQLLLGNCTVTAKKTVVPSVGKLIHSAGQENSRTFCSEIAQCRPSGQLQLLLGNYTVPAK